MSLLNDSMEAFTIQDKTTTSDGYGSVTTTYVDGAEIMGSMPLKGSMEIIAAQAKGSKATYNFIVRKSVDLDYHTVLKRKSDGKYFRLTSGTGDNQTPKGAGLNMRVYDAEEFDIGGMNG
jgi:head-tail adaptor